MPYIEMPDGVPIHYTDDGPRATRAVVLLPAEPFSCWFWQKNAPAIAGQYRVVGIDPRGRGQSGKAEARHTVPQFARDLRMVLGGLGIDRFLGVGWSLGGSVLWSFSELFGAERLAGVVNVDQRPYRWVGEDHLQGLLNEIRMNRLAYHVERAIEYMGPEFADDTALVRRMAYECMKTPTHAHLEAVEDSYRSDFRATMARLDVPTTLFVGRYGVIGPALAEELRAATRGALVEFPHSGHLLPWTEPERFNAAVLAVADRTIGGR